MTDRQTSRWIESSTLGAGTLLILALVGMLNYLSWKYYQRFDWTSDELYSLSEKSKNVVSALDVPIEAVVFMSPGEPLFSPVQELLSRYAAESSNFSVRVVDPEKNLVEAQALVNRFGLSHLDVIVFDRGDDRRVVESADLADYDYSGLQAGRGPEMTGFKGEQVFSGVILALAEDRKPRVLFTTGHGELSLDDPSARGLAELEALLGRDNFDLEEWSPLAEPEVPQGVDAVVVAGPTTAFVEPEVEALRAYLASGGRLVALLDPILSESGVVRPTGLESLLAEFGVELGADIVIDPAAPIPFFGAETFFVSSYGDHEVTRPLRQAEIPVIVPLAQSVRMLGDMAELGASSLLETTAEGWGEADLGRLGEVARGPEDLEGPVAIAVAIELEEPKGEVSSSGDATAETESSEASGARLVVFGDSGFASNTQLRNVGNAELAVNTINWLVARDNLIAIPAKKTEQVRLSLSGGDLRTIGLLVFLVLPGLAIVAGAVVYSRRRR